MKKRLGLLLLMPLLTFNLAWAETPVFGPEKFVRAKGEPSEITKSFTVPNPEAEFRIVVQNGAGKRGAAASGIIKLNGHPLITPDSFKKNTDLITLPITLQGTNTLAVEVRSAPGSSIIVTILGPGAPGASAFKGVRANPDGFPVNSPTTVTFNASIPYDFSKPVPIVEIQHITPEGLVLGSEGFMLDNGNLSIGDEIQGDGVFSFQKVYELSQPGSRMLRVKATIEGQVYYSNTFSVFAFVPLSEADVQAMHNVQDTAIQRYYQVKQGEGNAAALKAALRSVQQDPLVQSAGISEGVDNVWITYVNGLGAVLAFNPPGTRGGGSMSPFSPLPAPSLAPGTRPGNIAVESTKVLILSPFLDEFCPNGPSGLNCNDEGPALELLYKNHNTDSGCPQYDITYKPNGVADVDAFRNLRDGQYGIIHVASHGTTYGPSSQPVIATRTSPPATHPYPAPLEGEWNAGKLVEYVRVRVDPLTGNTLPPDRWFAVTPAFFTNPVPSLPSSLVFFSACYSAQNQLMSDALLAAGAQAYLGFTGDVPFSFAKNTATYFHNKWINDPSALTVREVFSSVGSSVSLMHPTTRCHQILSSVCWKLYPTPTLSEPMLPYLEAPLAFSGVLNGSFESGTLGAWTKQGDGRVVTQLDPFRPTDGQNMGLISTGLGFTINSGSIEQKVCLPPNTRSLALSWNFISEEFKEWCGSIFQDFFKVELIGRDGTTSLLLNEYVDKLCPSQLSQFPNGFVQGDAWSTGWRTDELPISAPAPANAGRPVTIRLSTGDVSDDIYDTAILLDNIRLITQ